MLTSEQITKFSARKGVKVIAVQNFLGTLGGSTQSDALANLEMDARSYRWNAATVGAIRAGIVAHFKG